MSPEPFWKVERFSTQLRAATQKGVERSKKDVEYCDFSEGGRLLPLMLTPHWEQLKRGTGVQKKNAWTQGLT